MDANVFHLALLRSALRPFRLHWFPRLRSTNDHAAVLRRRGGLFAPAVVLTGHQLAGRGRGRNAWWSGAGCLTATFVLPVDEQLEPHQVPLLSGLGVRRAVVALTGDHERVQLKWPNDLLVDGRKLAGLLCERVEKVDLIGVGLNVNLDPRRAPRGLRERIASLSQIAGRAIDMTQAVATIGAELHRVLSRRDEQPFSAALREYDEHHALLGRRVRVIGADGASVSGLVVGLDPMGRLLLRSRGRLQPVIAGQVMLDSQ